MPGDNKEAKKNIAYIFTHYLECHVFLTSLNTKFPYHDRFLESINRPNRGIPVLQVIGLNLIKL